MKKKTLSPGHVFFRLLRWMSGYSSLGGKVIYQIAELGSPHHEVYLLIVEGKLRRITKTMC